MTLLDSWRRDLPASVVVFFVAVPLCLGIALASGAPPISGLIAGIVGGALVGVLSGSPLGVSGPAAGLAIIVLKAIERLGTFEAFLVAVVLAGLMQIGLGFVRAGILGYFFPSAVIKGMLSGIGIIIILKQIPHALGVDTDPEGDQSFFQIDGETTFSALGNMLDEIEPVAALLSTLALLLLIGWDKVLAPRHRVFRLVQGPIVVVALGILYQAITRDAAPNLALTSEHLVNVPVAEGFTGFLELFTHPDWTQLGNLEIYLVAGTMAIVASLETLLYIKTADKLDELKRVTPTNRELVAQGVGNTVSGLIGGLPITQVIVRSSANIQSGALTKLSAITHGILLFVFVVVFPSLLNLIPLAVLASILFVVGYKLAQPKLFRQIHALGMSQFLPFLVTIVGIVLTDLLFGIIMGLGVAHFFILRRNYLNSHFLHIEEADVNHSGRRIVKIRLSEEVTFLNKGSILHVLSEIPNGSHVVIDLRACFSIDYDVIEIIEDFKATAESRQISVEQLGELRVEPDEGFSERARRAEDA